MRRGGIVIVVAAAALALQACGGGGGTEKEKNERILARKGESEVVLATSKGEIVLRLYPDRAPGSAANFLRYVDDGFYDGLVFHRVVGRALVQTGAYEPGGKRRPPTRPPIPLEVRPDLHNVDGAVALSRSTAPESGAAEFFIEVGDHPELDGEYAVFGKVVEGMDVVRAIASLPTERRGALADWPREEVLIQSASIR